ncbi:fatty acid desaturase [Xylariales sp. AK1849]|nr:fatty acid desaturase [Xylariales sp. AK1849]
MKAYRIGRTHDGPWVNMTPPIRGGIFRKEESATEPIGTDTDEDDLDDDRSLDLSDRTSLTSDCSSANSIAEKVLHDVVTRRRTHGHGAPVGDKAAAEDSTPLSRAEYTDLVVQQETDQDIQDYPSLDPMVQADIVCKYRELHERVRNEGFYDCPYLKYAEELARYATLFTASMVALSYNWYMTSAVFLGLFWHQIMFTAHDGGHGAITHVFAIDSLIAIFIADFCCGLSMGWWKSSHNVHHLVTNQPEHDPDIQNTPLFATCPSFFRSIRSTYYDGFVFAWDAVADVMVPYQKYTYYPIMGLARFNLYLLSWLHVLSAKSSSLGSSKAWWIRPTEITFMACYWFLFGYCLVWRTLPTWTIRVAFVLVSHIITMPLHVQITLSHWGMPTTDLGESESFPQRQLRTTMDVDCPAWLDWIHGGLQFQAVHHLFPRVPRHNLRRLQVLVREFCEKTEIPYITLNFTDGNRKVLSRLEQVGEQVRVLVECQKHMAETGESGLA